MDQKQRKIAPRNIYLIKVEKTDEILDNFDEFLNNFDDLSKKFCIRYEILDKRTKKTKGGLF